MNFQNIIKELCEEKGIEYEVVSNGWLIVLKKDHIIKTIFGYKFDLNGYNIAKQIYSDAIDAMMK